MPSTTSPEPHAQTSAGGGLRVGGVDSPPIAARPTIAPRGLYDRALPLRLFCIRILNYLTNHVVAHVPSFTLRRMWYRHAVGIDLGPGATVFLGAYVWFCGPRETRRRGVAIGRNSRINRDCTLDIRCGLTIGDHVSVSPEVMILGLSHDYNDSTFIDWDAGPVTIEDYVWIGARAMILPGVTVGRGAVVAAGSVVAKDVAPMTVVAGVPAKPIAARDEGTTAYAFGPPPLFE